ncbi:MAG: hypothetical protein N3A66_00695 [Planctomycetota bacterium]|nr:hypothetical protein [Planctomycetota bacterium]
MTDSMNEGQALAVLRSALAEMPANDVHSHLHPDALAARHLGDILLYHFVATELLAAGAPPEHLSRDLPAEERLARCLPYFPLIANTATWWCVCRIMADLYDLDFTALDRDRLQAGWEAVGRSYRDRHWPRQVLVERARLHTTIAMAQHLPHPAFRRHRFLAPHWEALYFGPHKFRHRYFRRSDDIPPWEEFTDKWEERLAAAIANGNIGYAGHLDSEFQRLEAPPSDLRRFWERMRRGAALSAAEQNALSTRLLHATLAAIGKSGHYLQLFTGARWPVFVQPPHYIAKSLAVPRQTLAADLAEFLQEYPRSRVSLMCCTPAMSHELTVLCRMFPNLTLTGFWWHVLFHRYIEEIIAERVDMLPANKWLLVATDAYHVEWSYGKIAIAKEALARVLARRVAEARLTIAQALFLAERVLFTNAREIYGL